MADIQIVYRVGYCEFGQGEYDTQCHTACGADGGCRYFLPNTPNVPISHLHSEVLEPFGDCARAKFKYIHKGGVWKQYEMEEQNDPYNPHLDCMEVLLAGQVYDCVKVVLDGKCIYNEYDEDGDTNAQTD